MHSCYRIQKSTPLMGRASVYPSEPVVAGAIGTWTFIYTAGIYGIEDSGAIRLCWRMVSDWECPQTSDPRGYAYTTVRASAPGCEFLVQYDRFIRPYTNSLLIRLLRGSLKEGDTITITWGDTTEGGPGARAQSYQEKEHEFLLLVDPTGSGVFRLVEKPITLEVQAGDPYRLQAVLPGSVKTGEPFALTVRCLDALGNPAFSYRGEPEVLAREGAFPRKISFADSRSGVIRIEGCRAERPGVLRVEVKDPENGFSCISNPCLVTEEEKRLLWADMHGQNADTLGSGSLDAYYSFARDVAAVDATGWQGNDFEITDTIWEHVKERTQAYNEDGRFVTFLGYEWSGCTPRGGDFNVFYRGDEENFYPSSDWLSQGEIDPQTVTTPVSNLWERFRGREDVLAIPHVGGRCGNLAFVDEDMTPAVEVHSHHGTFDWFALEAMKRHLHVGFVGSSDDHTCRTGMFLPCAGKTPSGGFDVASGYTGIWAEAFTKESIWKALKARHCYASTFTRICAQAHLGKAMMGDRVEIEEETTYRLFAAGAIPVERICLYNWEKEIADIPLRQAEEDRILIRFSGVIPGGKHKSTRWDGSLAVEGSDILEAAGYGFDREDQGIRWDTSSRLITWNSTSSGDYEGVKIRLSDPAHAILRFASFQGNCEVRAEDLTEHPRIVQLNENCKVEFLRIAAPLEAGTQACVNACEVRIEYPVTPPEEEMAIWSKVILENGDAAWITPVFVRKKTNHNKNESQ